jgi:hypothetical protein
MRVRRTLELAVVAGLALGAAAAPAPALADNEPVIVIPGRIGVPVLMNGVDVSGAVIEGEWGLNRPGVVVPTVIMPYRVLFWSSGTYGTGDVAPYYPRTGHKPRYGRLEVVPKHRQKPRPAERYHREWHSESDPGPATLVPFDPPPPVIVSPRFVQPHPHPPHTP